MRLKQCAGEHDADSSLNQDARPGLPLDLAPVVLDHRDLWPLAFYRQVKGQVQNQILKSKNGHLPILREQLDGLT